MSDNASTSRRRDEIERKKQKIAELKRAREERSKALHAVKETENMSHAARRKELEDLVASLVGERARKQDDVPTLGHVAPTLTQIKTDVLPSAPMAASPDLDGDELTDNNVMMIRKPAPKLVMTSMITFENPPQEKVYYEKEIQTADSSFQTEDADPEPATKEAEQSTEPVVQEPTPEPEPEKLRELEDYERDMILHSEPFQDFFDRSAKLIERALNSKYDVLTDYTLTDDFQGDIDTGKGVKHTITFSDDRWTKNRSVTDISWSPRHPELLLASYNKNQSSISDPDGVVLIWNLHAPERPEFMFHAQSDVTAACFSEFHPHMVLGGTYSGQILIWDTRTKRVPVLKTPLSAAGAHTHPVYSMHVVGTQNAHSLVTCSTDGTVCSWQMDMLAHPQEVLELAHSPMDSTNLRPTNEIAVTTLGFPANETTTFWVGTEEGVVYQANRYDRAGGKAGINSLEPYVGHDGNITSLHFHPLNGPLDFSDLFLTTSVDWTVNLWKAKNPAKQNNQATASTTPVGTTMRPLCTFEESDDYVYDAKWSPVHPSVFACVDGSGILDVYDLNQETETASASVTLGGNFGNSSSSNSGASGFAALNKLAWDKSGAKIAVGAADGKVHVVDVGEIGVPKPDSWVQFQKTLAEMGHGA
ncbi:hypothetical protein HDU78_006651 [Chytriomyces hyalinus]|nr:hypothetical protein HDU78_006651 [Chytriomyces hyalinus]